jgi:hypothetical protein
MRFFDEIVVLVHSKDPDYGMNPAGSSDPVMARFSEPNPQTVV